MYLMVGILFLGFFSANAQKPKVNPFQMVDIHDSIYVKFEESYKKSTSFDSVNAGRNAWNLLDRKDFAFKNGLYSFKGQGPHFPKRIFIYNNGKTYIFTSSYVDKVLLEYLECIKLLDLSEADKIKYLKMISIYLEEEKDKTYGAEIK